MVRPAAPLRRCAPNLIPGEEVVDVSGPGSCRGPKQSEIVWQNKGELPGILKRIELFFIKPSGKRISCYFHVIFPYCSGSGFLTPRDSCWCFVEDPGIPNTSSSISITETWCLDLQKKTWGKHRCDPIRMVRIDPRLNQVVWMFVGDATDWEYGSTGVQPTLECR